MKKLIYYIIGVMVFMGILGVLFTMFIYNKVSDPDKLMDGFFSKSPVFSSGTFSEDGKYFAYTYQEEVNKPDVNGSVTMRGFSYPSYFQIIETQTGKKLLSKPFETKKGNQLYIICFSENAIWLMKNDGKHQLALFDINKNDFKYKFGELEQLNTNISWANNYSFFYNTSTHPGLILEANDKRYYCIDPTTGKASIIQGQFPRIEYNRPNDLQVSSNTSDRIFHTKRINGSRQSIFLDRGKISSEDDFIEAKFLMLDKGKTIDYFKEKITFHNNFFFVLSPISSDDDVKMELAMLDKNTLKTKWKINLPQNALKTFIPKYNNERFFLKESQLLVSNNDYLMSLDLNKGNIIQQISLFK